MPTERFASLTANRAVSERVSTEFERQTDDISDISDQSPLQIGTAGTLCRFSRIGRSPKRFCQPVLEALERRCPEHIDHQRWRQVIADGAHFLVQWGKQALPLGWTARDLFGLAEVPDKPGPNYQRLARYDQTGLVWILQGRPVVALTKDSALIETASGTVSYCRHNKPALGPHGDSLDDMGSR